MIIRVVGSRGLPQMVEIVTYSEVRRACKNVRKLARGEIG